MQDIHAIGGGGVGGGGRLFNGGVADRRLRPQHQHHHHQNLQALKCPRCDSLNTKFCYYNNYNLSQPRHFCKSCRRYWTKGGVLRNVPVGGGCRKTKRSKPKQNASATTTATTDTGTLSAGPPPSQQQQPQERELISSNSHSSSESSSLTAAVTNATAEAVSAPSSSSASNNLFNGGIGESKLFGHPSMNQDFETGLMEQPGSDCGIFSEIGNFTSLMSPSNDQHLSFGFNMLNAQSLQDQVQLNQNQQWNPPPHKVVEMDGDGMKIPELAGGLIGDRTVQSELSALQNNRSGNSGGFGPLDWQGNGDQGFFDLPNAVDQSYWSHSHWATDQDHPGLYLP